MVKAQKPKVQENFQTPNEKFDSEFSVETGAPQAGRAAQGESLKSGAPAQGAINSVQNQQQ